MDFIERLQEYVKENKTFVVAVVSFVAGALVYRLAQYFIEGSREVLR